MGTVYLKVGRKQRAILRFIAYRASRGEVTTAIDVANAFPVESRMFGRQRNASQTIALLRKRGYLRDVERCPICNRAQTRGRRNVPLFLTAAGMAAIGFPG